jgi:hypothetical protein
MVDNILYDLDSSSSSDSDSSPSNQPKTPSFTVQVTLSRIVSIALLFQFRLLSYEV